jgi:hypothetical protein
MYVMTKRIDLKVKERWVQQVPDHVADNPNPTAAAQDQGVRKSGSGS